MIRNATILVALGAALVALASCSSYNRAMGSKFYPTDHGTYIFEANAGTTPGLSYLLDDPGDEATRMEWLRFYLEQNNLCPDNYEILSRKPLVTGLHTALGTGYTIYFEVRCAEERDHGARIAAEVDHAA